MQQASPWLTEDGGLQDPEPYSLIIRDRERGHVRVAQSCCQKESNFVLFRSIQNKAWLYKLC